MITFIFINVRKVLRYKNIIIGHVKKDNLYFGRNVQFNDFIGRSF